MSNKQKTSIELATEMIDAVNGVDIPNSTEELLRQIHNVIDELRGNGLSGKKFEDYFPTELSVIAGHLAVLKTSLGEVLAIAERNVESSKNFIDLRKANLRDKVVEFIIKRRTENTSKNVKLKTPTVADIEDELKRQLFRENTINTIRKEHYSRCLNLWRSLNSLLDVIDMRVRVLTSERSDTKFLSSDMGIDFSESLEDIDVLREDDEVMSI